MSLEVAYREGDGTTVPYGPIFDDIRKNRGFVDERGRPDIAATHLRQNNPAGNFHFRRRANHLYDSRRPVPEEGALAIVTERWDGMWWTRRCRA
jgi:hypothetical protein